MPAVRVAPTTKGASQHEKKNGRASRLAVSLWRSSRGQPLLTRMGLMMNHESSFEEAQAPRSPDWVSALGDAGRKLFHQRRDLVVTQLVKAAIRHEDRGDVANLFEHVEIVLTQSGA